MTPATADVLARHMSEEQLLTVVLQMARALRLCTAHFRPARTEQGWRTAVSGDGKGFPDLVIVGRRVLYRELKRMGEHPTAAQMGWLTRLEDAGQDVELWRPADLRSGRIERELREVA